MNDEALSKQPLKTREGSKAGRRKGQDPRLGSYLCPTKHTMKSCILVNLWRPWDRQQTQEPKAWRQLNLERPAAAETQLEKQRAGENFKGYHPSPGVGGFGTDSFKGSQRASSWHKSSVLGPEDRLPITYPHLLIIRNSTIYPSFGIYVKLVNNIL